MRFGGPPDAELNGFTLLELMIIVTILAVVVSIGMPQYGLALRTARVGKTKHELVTISHAIDAFRANHGGRLPLTLYEVGFGGKRDPWGLPYCYLNYGDGTGDGLDWAIDAGIVHASAYAPVAGGDGGGTGAQEPQRPQELPAPETDSGPTFTEIVASLNRQLSTEEHAALTRAIMHYGNFSIFTAVPTVRTRRRDRHMFPINTDYDLLSLGPDGLTAPSLDEPVGLNDVLRANNGGFFGSASDY